MIQEDITLISYPELDQERIRDLFRRIPQEAFWGIHEIDPDSFYLDRYVDYFSKNWAPEFHPVLMLAVERGDGEYAGLLHLVLEGRRAAMSCFCTDSCGPEAEELLANMIREGEARALGLGAERIGIPMVSGLCLTCGVDSANLGSVIFFRKLGFKPVEVFYSMSLDLTRFEPPDIPSSIRAGLGDAEIEYRHVEREDEQIWEMLLDGERAGKFEIGGIRNGITDVGIDIVKEHRGRGLGTLLFNEGLSRIKEIGVRRAELAVDGDNIAAISLYSRAGFSVDRTFLVMDKVLHSEECPA